MATPTTPSTPRSTPSARAARSKVKVAVSDIDGILRGKYLHIDKFLGAAEPHPRRLRLLRRGASAGTSADQCYDNTQAHRLAARLPRRAGAARPRHRSAACRGTATCRSSSASSSTPTARPSPICPRQTLEARARSAPTSSASTRCAAWSSSGSTSPRRRRRWAAKHGVDPEPITPGMFGYSLLRMNRQPRVLQRADGRDGAPSACRSRACTPRPGPGVYEVAIAFSEALEAGRPRDPVQDRRQGDRRALRHHAELHGQVEPEVPGLQRPHPPEPESGRQDATCSTTPSRRAR